MKNNANRFFAFMLAYALLFSLVSCNEAEEPEPEEQTSEVLEVVRDGANRSGKSEINITALKGPAALGMVTLMSTGGNRVGCDISIAADEEEIAPLISAGDTDIAACSLDFAAKLYEETDGGVKLIALGTLGTLYVLERGREISTVSDLRDRTVLLSGQGTETQYILEYILSANGLTVGNDVNIEYAPDDGAVAEKAVSGEADVVLLSEPFVRELVCNNTGFHAALDITDEWENVCEISGSESTLAQNCVVACTEFLEENVSVVEEFLSEYESSVSFVNSNVFDSSLLASRFGIIDDATLARRAIPCCNVTCITGSEMENIAKQNLETLFELAPECIGGRLPDESFYYIY